MSTAEFHIPYFHEIILFLMIAGIVVPILRRFGVSPILAFLVSGVVIGPYGLGLFVQDADFLSYLVIADVQRIKPLAEFGIVFLLFLVGLELSLKRLWQLRKLVFGPGILQLLVTSPVIAVIAYLFGNSAPVSILLGASLALSSTAIVVQWLIEKRLMSTPVGRTAFAILLVQDLAVVPILFMLGVFTEAGSHSLLVGFGVAFVKAAMAFVVIMALGGLIIRPMFRFIGGFKSSEMFVAITLLTVIATSAVAGLAGVSMALGAFLAGLLLSETEYRHEIVVHIEPFKGLLLGLFFMSVGMGVDMRIFLADPLWIVISVIGLFTIKSAIATGVCLIFKASRRSALEVGLIVGQGGEFGFVVVGIAVASGLMDGEVAQFMLIVVGLTMLLTPLVGHMGTRFSERLQKQKEKNEHQEDQKHIQPSEGHVIIAGFGRVGQMLAGILMTENIPFVAIDTDANRIKDWRQEGVPVYFGDAMHRATLDRMDADQAVALVLTIDDPKSADFIVQLVQVHWPDLPIYVRARDTIHATQLSELDNVYPIPENLEPSLQLAQKVLQAVGIPAEPAARIVAKRRAEFIEALGPEKA